MSMTLLVLTPVHCSVWCSDYRWIINDKFASERLVISTNYLFFHWCCFHFTPLTHSPSQSYKKPSFKKCFIIENIIEFLPTWILREAFDERRFSYQKIFLLVFIFYFFFVTFACVESVCVVANIVRRIMCFSHRSCCISLCEAFYIFVGYILLYKMSFYVACFHISIYLIQIHIPLAQQKKRLSSVAESKDLHKQKICIYVRKNKVWQNAERRRRRRKNKKKDAEGRNPKKIL